MKACLNIRGALLLPIMVLALFSCGGSDTSADSFSSASPEENISSVSSEEPSSSIPSVEPPSSTSSEELYTSNVSAVFSLDDDHNPIYTDDKDYCNPVLFKGYENFDELYRGIEAAIGEEEFSAMAGALEAVSDYMSSSDDYAFVVWMIFGHGFEGFWYDFYDNTLTRHQVYDCYSTDLIEGKMEVVMVSRDMVDDFETVAFTWQDHSICSY